MSKQETSGEGIGARVRRKEDARHLKGRGQFVGDYHMPQLQEVAFLRSPMAHARVVSKVKAPEHAARTFFSEDLTGVSPIVTQSSIPGYKVSSYPILAMDKVRFVGEPVAMCVAKTRAIAEDLIEQIEVEYEELPVVASCTTGRGGDAALLHEKWGDNLFLETPVDSGVDEAIAKAPVSIELETACSRQAMHPMEGK